MKKWILLLAVMLFIISGCAANKPQTFNPISNPNWGIFELRKDVNYDKAWQSVNEIIIDHYRIEFINKEIGYIRTSWRYGKNKDYEGKYRSMLEVKFTPDHNKVKLRATSQYMEDDYWIKGTDSNLISTLKTDIMGKIGRTSR